MDPKNSLNNEQKSNALLEFTKHEIPAEQLAQVLRRFQTESLRMFLVMNEDNHGYVNSDWIKNGHYWLNFLCETLDPNLTKPLS